MKLVAVSILVALARAAAALSVRQLYQFPSATQFIENAAILPNGHLLLDTFDNARMYVLDPASPDPTPRSVVQVSHANALMGIANIAPRLYAVSASIFNSSDISTKPGSSQIAIVRLDGCPNSAPALVQTAIHVPDARLLNGMASIPENPHVVLSGDSILGAIFRTNTRTGHADIVIQDDRLGFGTHPKNIPIGVNGVKIRRGFLYVTNSEKNFFGRYKIDRNGNQKGDLEIIKTFPADPPIILDDFVIARDGTVYLVNHHSGSLLMLTPEGQLTTLVGGNTTHVRLESPTAAVLSRDERTVYVTTGGGSGKGGQIIAVHL